MVTQPSHGDQSRFELLGVEAIDPLRRLPAQLGKDLVLLLLHVVPDAGRHHVDDGPETGLVHHRSQLGDAFAGQVVLGLGFFLGLVACDLLDDRVEVLLLHRHVHRQGLVQLIDQTGPSRLVGSG